MAGRHKSWNNRLILNLLDDSNLVESEALMVFLDFHKAFDTIEHQFMFLILGRDLSLLLKCFIEVLIAPLTDIQIVLKGSLFVEECAKVVLYPLFYFL